MFADDTKLIAEIRPQCVELDRVKNHDDIDKVSEWCKRLHMSLKTSNCKFLNIGRTKTESVYTFKDTLGNKARLISTSNERDLRIIRKDLKPHDQVCKADSTANKVLRMLNNTFSSRDVELWKR